MKDKDGGELFYRVFFPHTLKENVYIFAPICKPYKYNLYEIIVVAECNICVTYTLPLQKYVLNPSVIWQTTTSYF